jgi:hypothetical protein
MSTLLFPLLDWLIYHGALLLMQDQNMYVICYFDVPLNVNMRYCILFDVVVIVMGYFLG